MWIVTARGEYAEFGFADASEEIYYYQGGQNLAWIDHLLRGPATSLPDRSA